MQLHKIHCERNFFRCKECNEPIPIAEKEKHQQEVHQPKPCPDCGQLITPALFSMHDCPKRPKICQFCEAHIPSDQFADHITQCSSRTEQCPLCQKYIPLRDYDHHLARGNCTTSYKQQVEEQKMQDFREQALTEILQRGGEPTQEDIDLQAARLYNEELDRIYAEELNNQILQESQSPQRRPENTETTFEAMEEEFEPLRPRPFPRDYPTEEFMEELRQGPRQEPRQEPSQQEDEEAILKQVIEESKQDAPEFGDEEINQAIMKSLQER